MHNEILNLIRVAIFCALLLIATILGIPEQPQEPTNEPTAAPTEAPETTEKETPTETTIPEAEPVSATEPPTEEETEPPEPEPTYTQEDLELLALVIYQEAGADFCSDETRMMVGSVVMNRVADDRFPDTIYGVLMQRGQYGRLYWTGPVWPSRASRQTEAHAVERAYTIAERILQGERSLPEDVIFQSEYIMGEIVSVSDGFYFCR